MLKIQSEMTTTFTTVLAITEIVAKLFRRQLERSQEIVIVEVSVFHNPFFYVDIESVNIESALTQFEWLM